jgi:hypothetical protein
MGPIMASAYSLETCASFVPQRNGSVFPLNHESEMCVKAKYTIANVYWVNESMCILEYCVCSENQCHWGYFHAVFLYNFVWNMYGDLYRMSCSAYMDRIRKIFYECIFGMTVLLCILLKITHVSRLLCIMTYMFCLHQCKYF